MLSLFARLSTAGSGVSCTATSDVEPSFALSDARTVRSRRTVPVIFTPSLLNVSASTLAAYIGGSFTVTDTGSPLDALVCPRRMIELLFGSRLSHTLFSRPVMQLFLIVAKSPSAGGAVTNPTTAPYAVVFSQKSMQLQFSCIPPTCATYRLCCCSAGQLQCRKFWSK